MLGFITVLLAQVADATTVVTLDPFIVSVLAGTIIPVITGVVTKLEAASGVKAIVALVLSALVGILTPIVNQGGTFDWKVVLLSFAAAFVTNLATYLGMWKAIGEPYPPLAKATENFGLGSVPPRL